MDKIRKYFFFCSFDGGSNHSRTGEHSRYFGSLSSTDVYTGQWDMWQHNMGENRPKRSVSHSSCSRAATNVTGGSSLLFMVVTVGLLTLMLHCTRTLAFCLQFCISESWACSPYCMKNRNVLSSLRNLFIWLFYISLFLYVIFRVLSHMRLSCVNKYYLLTYLLTQKDLTIKYDCLFLSFVLLVDRCLCVTRNLCFTGNVWD